MKNLQLALILLLLLSSASLGTTATRRYVSNDPNIWQDKSPLYQTIAAAIEAAQSGDEIWVAKGTFAEHIILKDEVSLFGGFDNDDNTLNDRNLWDLRPRTIIDGTNTGRCIKSGSNLTIDGFEIVNGNTSGTDEEWGAGISVVDVANVDVRNVFVSYCTTNWLGSGIFVNTTHNGTIKIENAVVWRCSAYCGALEISDVTESRVIVRYCTIVENYAFGLEIPWNENFELGNLNHEFSNNICWDNDNPRELSSQEDVWARARDFLDYSFVGRKEWSAEADRWGESLPHNIFEKGDNGVGTPQFENRHTGDFRLTEYSPCIGAGENGKDMGAYRYNQQTTEPVLHVAPADLDFGETTQTLDFEIENSGQGTLEWTMSSDVNWISSFSLTSGSLSAGESATVTVENDRGNLVDGHYSGTIEISSNAGSQTLTVQMDVGASPPVIVVAPIELNFRMSEGGNNPGEQTLTITNSGAGNLAWTAAEASETAWLNLTNTSGGDGDVVRVAVDGFGLSPGTYNASIQISDTNAENSPVEVPVVLRVTTPQTSSILAEFQAETSTSLPNSAWEVTANDGEACVQALAGSSSRPNGSYELNYSFEVPEGVSQIFVFAEIDVNGDSDNDSFWLTLNGDDKCKWNGLYGLGDGWKREWIFDQGSDEQHSFAVTPGNYTLNFSPRESGGYVNWLVVTTDQNLNIENYEFGGDTPPLPPPPDEPQIAVTPVEFGYNLQLGSNNPAPQLLTVSNSGSGSLAWDASEIPEAAWLSLNRTSGVDGETIELAIDLSGLAAGEYECQIRITDDNAVNSPVDVPVTLTVSELPETPEPPEPPSGAILAQFEAEASASLPNDGWEVTTNEDAGCIMAVLNSATRPDANYRLSYSFEVPQGTNTIYVFAEVDANKDSDDDSFWITVNDGDECKWNGLRSLGDGWQREWVFDQRNDTQHAFSVSPGTNTVSIYPRENGGFVNWLVVTTDGNLDIENYEFTGDTPQPSPPEEPQLTVNPSELNFNATESGNNPAAKTITVSNSGSGSLDWTAAESPEADWLSLSNTSGSAGESIEVMVALNDLAAGNYSCQIRITDPNAANSPVEVPVTLTISGTSEPSDPPDPPSDAVLAEIQAEASVTLPNAGWDIIENFGELCVEAAQNESRAQVDEYRLDFAFEVPAGVERIYVFAEIDVNNRGYDDSFWVTLNGSNLCQWKNLENPGEGWHRAWVFDREPGTQYDFQVQPGLNVLNFYPREKSVYLNWVVVTTDPETDIQNYALQTSQAKFGIANQMFDKPVETELPSEFRLFQNFPNPFNPATRIQFALPEAGQVQLTIYNTLGQVVRDLFHGNESAGLQSVLWDGRNNAGEPVRSGIYFYRLKWGRHVSIRRMSLLR